MKKLLFSLFTALSFLSLSAQTQYVIDFESSFAGDSTISSGGQTFGVTTVNDTYRVYNFTNGGWNGTTTDNYFLDNSGGGASGGNTTLQFGMLYSGNFTLQELYLYVSQSNINLAHTSGSVTFEGKRNGSTVFLIVKSTGFASPATKSPNNGFTLIDFATEGGADFSSTPIDQIVITTTGDINYLAMDAFKWTLVSPVSVGITSASDVSCNGGSDGTLTASITGGTPNYTYSWSNGSTTSNTSSTSNTITGLIAGHYTLTVTDNIGSTNTVTGVVSQPSALSASNTSSTNVTCGGGSNGSVSFTAQGGGTPYTYSWSNGNTGSTNSGIPAGTYTVTVTDGFGCTLVNAQTITEPTVLTASIVNQINVTSTGGNDGYAEAAGAGGTSPYTYVWSSFSTNRFLTFAPAGTYTVSVTDNNGCGPATASVYISEPAGPVSVSISSVNHVSCNGGSDGEMSAIVTPGLANYDYFWSNGVSDTNSSVLFNTLSNLTTGTYTVTVVDDNGTTATAAAFISQPSLLQASNTSSSNVTCNGGSNGSATTGAIGGTAPYTYTWSSGDTSSTAVNLSAGTVTVTITDNNGCTATQPFSITEPSAVLASISAQTNVSTFGASDGSATASGSGGTSPYTYAWSNSATTASITNVMAGTYTVSITDNLGCGPGTATATITQPTCIQTADTVQAGTSTDVSSDNTRSPFTTAFEDARHQYIVFGPDLNAAGGCDGELAGMAFNVISASPAAINATIKLKHTTEFAFSDPNFETGGFTTVYSGTFTPSNGWYWIDFSTNFNWDGTSNILVEFCFDNSSFTSNSSLQVSSTFINTHRYAYANGTSGCSLSSNGTNAYIPNTRFRYPSLTVSPSITNVTCNGLTDGSISTSVGGGTMPYSYAWSNGDTLSSISGLAAGTYTLTVTDINSVKGVAAITVTEPSQLSVSTSSTDVDCNGYSNGTVTATPSGGTAPYKYAWDSGDTTATSTSLPAGPWNVTVTDANGCTATGTATISEPAILVAATVVDSNITCNGFADGGATASATGGISPYTYLWSNSATTASITGVIAGTYTVTVTDNKGCTNSSTATITQPSSLSATATIGQNASCNGASDGIINSGATGGTAPYTYSWSNGATPASNTNLSAGTYTVTITDNNGCTDVSSATVTEPGAVNVSISSQTNLACNGANTGAVSASGSGGASPYTYLWSNGSTTASISNLTAGSYTVTLTDNNGCTNTVVSTITEPSAISLSVVETAMTCPSNDVGVLSASASGGAGSFSYLWDTGDTSSVLSGLASGTYFVTVTDGNGCTSVASNSVNSYASPVAQFNLNPQTGSSLPHTVFFTDQSTLPDTWYWDFGDGNTSTAQNPIHSYTSTGTHYVTLTVTDTVNGCQSTALDSVFISPVVVTVGLGSQVTCNGSSDGSLLATVSLGTTPLTYSWSNGASSVTSSTFMTLTNLAAGTYTVTVTDNSGATATASGTLTDPPVLSATTSTTNVSCNGGNNGTATVTGTGGESPYTYVWSNGQTTGTTVSLAAGTYTVTLSDNRGCTTVANASVTEPNALVPTATVVQDVSCNGGGDASINSSAVGGTAPYTYQWSNGSTTANVSSLVAGTYTVTITDNNGCTAANSATATEPTSLVPALVIDSNVSCNGFSNGGVTASASGGTAPYTYFWSNAASTASITGVMAGTYTVTITDNKGCTASLSDVITEPTTLVAASVVDSNATCSGINNGGATASGTGGTMPYTYLWSNSATTASITGVAAGTYTVSLTDNQGCTASSSVTITEPFSLAPVSVVDSNVSCNGLSDGGATASATGGTMPYTYLWSNSATTASITGVNAGTYTVTITDNQGCTASSASTVTEPAVLTAATVVDNNVSCNGLSDGGLTASATGGTVPYTYVWSNSATTASITGLPAGTYTVTLTDNNGCSNTSSNTITEPTTLIASASLGSNVSCNGLNDGQANGSATGGTSPYTYTWSNGGTMTNATNLTAGTYTLTVTDANGCTDQASQVVTEPTLLVSSASLDNNATCNNAPDGGATASAVGGTAPYTYTWSNAANTASISGVINGTYYVTITDANACTDSSSVIIGVSDIINPVAVANDTTLYLDGNGAATVTAAGINNGSNDACGIQSLQLDNTSFGCSELGPNTVELLVIDVNGNRDSTTAVVTVLDTVSPVINSCPSNISVSNDAGVCGAVVNWTLPGASDNCTVDSLVSNFNSGDLFPVGTTLVTYTAYDQSMNTSTCSFTITVTDNEKPALVNVPANIVVSNDSASCDALVSWTAPTANDNCQVDSVRSNYQPGTVFPLGTTTVEYIAYDANLNTDTMSFTITVNDTELPTIVCPANIAQCDSLVTFTAPVGVDNCAGAVTVRTDGLTLNSGDLFPVGVTTLSYQVTDASNNQATCSFDIEVYSPPQVNAGPDLSTRDIEPIQIQAVISNADSIQWSPFFYLNNGNIEKPLANPQETTTFTVDVFSPDGCADSDEMTITVNVVNQLDATTLFTPNGDGRNDTWVVNKPSLVAGCKLVIFNRNGTEVFSTTNYQNDWDATINGSQLPEGTYYYIFDCPDGRTLNGPISVIREKR